MASIHEYGIYHKRLCGEAIPLSILSYALGKLSTNQTFIILNSKNAIVLHIARLMIRVLLAFLLTQ